MKKKVLIAGVSVALLGAGLFLKLSAPDTNPLEVTTTEKKSSSHENFSISKIKDMKAEETSSSPSKVELKKANFTEEEILKKLNDDDACGLFSVDYDEKLMTKALLEKMHSPLAQALAGEDGPMQGKPGNYQSMITLFFNALLYSNLLEGVSFSPVDPQYSLQLLKQLEDADPENGAFSYYYAVVLAQMGRSPDEQRAALFQAMSAPYFNTYLREFAQSMISELAQNATTWRATLGFLSKIPVPKAISKSLIGQLFSNPTADEAKMVSDFGLRLNQSDQSIGIELAVGTRLMKQFWKAANPEKIPPPLKDLKSEILNNGMSAKEYTDGLRKNPCDRSDLDQGFEQAKRLGFSWK